MNDPKNPEDDIIASAPEELSDEQLVDADGGILRGMHVDPVIPGGIRSDTVYGGGLSETIYAGGIADTIYGGAIPDLFGGFTKFKR